MERKGYRQRESRESKKRANEKDGEIISDREGRERKGDEGRGRGLKGEEGG